MSRSSSDPELQALLESAGPRPEPSRERLHAVTVAARQAWREDLEARSVLRVRRRRWAMAIGAAVATVALLSVGLALRSRDSLPLGPPRSQIGSVARLEGMARAGGFRGSRLLAVGAGLETGDEIETVSGFVSVALADGSSLRLAAGTRARLVAPAEIELRAGALYLQSAAAQRESAGGLPDVVTPFATVSDLGTQYEVRLLDSEGSADREGLRIRVREGEVRIATAGGGEDGAAVHGVAAGAEALLTPSGELEEREIPRSGPLWRWVLDAAPSYPLRDSDLAAFLRWLGRETGWRVEIADPSLRARLGEIEIHVPSDLHPVDAAEAVLRSAGLSGELRDGVFAVAPSP